MDVGIRCVWHVVVDDMRDIFHIETACRDVGGNHNGEVTTLETTQRLLTLSLCTVAVKARHTEPRVCNLAGDLICAMFGACEDQHRFGCSLFEQF
jgi:hypothetical protein